MAAAKETDAQRARGRRAGGEGHGLDAVVLYLAFWTLTCNVGVQLGWGFERLLLVALYGALPLVLALGAAALLARGAPSVGALEAGPASSSATPSGRARAAALVLAAGLTLLLSSGAGTLLGWWLLVLYFAAACWVVARRGARGEERPQPSRLALLALCVLALGCGFFAVSVHDVSPDDAYYVNVAVAALDRPELPLLRFDTMHGIEGAPAMYTVYRVHSHELLIALVARLLGLQAIWAAHAVLPPVFAVLAVFAGARLMRRLVPRRWLLATLFLVAILLVVTETQQSYGPFTFLRLQQGKAVFLGLLLPTILVHGLDCGARPAWRSGLLLAAAQIAAVGMTSTAIWCAPAVGVLALVAGTAARSRGGAPDGARGAPWRRLLLGLLACAYPLSVGLAFHAASVSEVTRLSEEGVRLVRETAEPLQDGVALVAGAWRVVLGDGPFAVLALFATLAAWVLAPTPAARALGAVFPLGVLLILLNPYAALRVASSVTGSITYWRVLWVLPVPLFLALCFTAPAGALRARPVLGAGLAVCVAALCLWLLPQRLVLDRSNRLMVRPFAIKSYAPSWSNASALALNVPRGAHVLVSRGVATSVPMVHRHPWPLVVRKTYLYPLEGILGAREVEERVQLYDYVSGDSAESHRELLERALRRYPLDGVCFKKEGPYAGEIRALLARAGLQQVIEKGGYETWTTLERQRERERIRAGRERPEERE